MILSGRKPSRAPRRSPEGPARPRRGFLKARRFLARDSGGPEVRLIELTIVAATAARWAASEFAATGLYEEWAVGPFVVAFRLFG